MNTLTNIPEATEAKALEAASYAWATAPMCHKGINANMAAAMVIASDLGLDLLDKEIVAPAAKAISSFLALSAKVKREQAEFMEAMCS